MARNEFWQTHKRKIVWGVLFLLLILAGVWWWTHRTTESKESYVLGQVTTGSIASSIDATGAIEPVNEVKLSANISGTLTQVFVKENQHFALAVPSHNRLGDCETDRCVPDASDRTNR